MITLTFFGLFDFQIAENKILLSEEDANKCLDKESNDRTPEEPNYTLLRPPFMIMRSFLGWTEVNQTLQAQFLSNFF